VPETGKDKTGASEVFRTKTVRKAKAVKKPVKRPVKKRAKVKSAFNSIIRDVASRHQVDPAIIKAIIMVESSYNPWAVSKRGAKGLMQLMPTTAKSLGVQDSFNPEQNINAGVRYFKHLLKRFNHDTTLALAAYNAGSRHVRKYNGVPPFNSTKRYIEKVYRYHKIYQKDSDG
jgi:soluble lytic murein transglycosylase-like protein